MKYPIRVACLLASGLGLLIATGCSTKGTSIPAAPPTGLQLQPLLVPSSVFPAATYALPTGIRGNLITFDVYQTGGTTVGAIENQSNGLFTPIAFPGAASTATYGPDVTSIGYRAVGSYLAAGSIYNQGFVYDTGSNAYTTLNPPTYFCIPVKCNETIMHSIYGDTTYQAVGNTDTVVGAPTMPGVYPTLANAFMYDSSTSTYSLINVPNSIATTAYGIWEDGSTIALAGGFSNSSGIHGYVRSLSGSNFLAYDYPGSTGVTHFEGITGAGGPGNYNVIGDATINGGEVGFFLPISNWQAGTPVAIGTVTANSVYQQTVIGVQQVNNAPQGFITTIGTNLNF